MEFFVKIGGLTFSVNLESPIEVEENYLPFLTPPCADPDVRISFIRDWLHHPPVTGPRLGSDLLLEFYPGENGLLCHARGGAAGALAVTAWDGSCRQITCWLNDRDYIPQSTLGNLLRLIPMRRIFLHHGAVLLHASQIALDGKGILFTAPSGTGKSTQARLWEKYRHARLVCNDRTLLRDGKTYGYPMDGSQPVAQNSVNALGAIVVLGQAPENHISRLRPSAALSALMSQLVLDCWDGSAKEAALSLLMELVSTVPVYRLRCTPEESAVACLEQSLKEDGVIS